MKTPSTLVITSKVGPGLTATACVVPFRLLEIEDDTHIIRTTGYDHQVREFDASVLNSLSVTIDNDNGTVTVTVA